VRVFAVYRAAVAAEVRLLGRAGGKVEQESRGQESQERARPVFCERRRRSATGRARDGWGAVDGDDTLTFGGGFFGHL
jgi:hypothetical protein